MFDRFSAIRLSPAGDEVVIITIFADDAQEARQRIAEELGKAGRGHFLRDWRRDGEVVRKKKPFAF